jgi:signal transduction histidine kinase
MLELGSSVLEYPGRDLVLEAQTTPTYGEDGRELGTSIIFTDITRERRQRERIEVLNRVLRHNLRTEVQLASGYVETIDDERADQLKAQHQRISHLGEKAGEIEAVLQREPTIDQPAPLSRAIGKALGAAPLDDDGPEIKTAIPHHVDVTVNDSIVADLVTELLANAIEHADASEIRVWFDVTDSTLIVADDGTGMDRDEIETLHARKESALDHASGLGLWLINWGIDRMGGTIDFETGADGTEIRLELPPEHVHASPAVVDRQTADSFEALSTETNAIEPIHEEPPAPEA